MFQYVIMSNHLKIPLIIITIALYYIITVIIIMGWLSYLYLSSI